MYNYDSLNTKLAALSKQCEAELKQEMERLGMKHGDEPLNRSLKLRITKRDGMIERIRFSFKRSGVFVHKGVGRGTKASEVGSTKRKAKEWFNPILEKYADKMMEAVADEMVEITFKNIRIK